jgi:deoxyribonuclease-4
MNKRVGLHIRLTENLEAAAQKALRLELPFFQCFLTHQDTNRLLQLSTQEIDLFVKEYRHQFAQLYVHGSYWINLAGIRKNGVRAYQRESMLAKKLGFTHMVLHSGSATGAASRQQGVEQFASVLNRILKYEHDLTLVIENTAHANMNVGSDITDFRLLLEKLDYPDKIKFALDTAHAFVYGYDVGTALGQDQFLQLVHDTVNLERVVLLHVNDALKERGSCIDKHGVPGEGLIGGAMLKRFATHERCAHIPIIVELPVIPEYKEIEVLERVRTWDRE